MHQSGQQLKAVSTLFQTYLTSLYLPVPPQTHHSSSQRGLPHSLRSSLLISFQQPLNSSHHSPTPYDTMRLTSIVLSLVSLACAAELGIETTHKVECTRKTKNGDGVSMHYSGKLQDTGKQFDSSYSRNSPLSFKLGTGRVIKG